MRLTFPPSHPDCLLSAADDRTVRVWHVPSRPHGERRCKTGTGALIQPRLTLWGHQARVWDAVCLNRCARLAAAGDRPAPLLPLLLPL